MTGLSSTAILRAWELGLERGPHERALILLETGNPELTREDLLRSSIGQRDARLLDLREQTFGPVLEAYAECPACRVRLEFSLATADIRVTSAAPPTDEALDLVVGDVTISYRLPNSADALAAAGEPDAASARQCLLDRCVLRASRDGAPISAAGLPEELVAAVGGAMAERDPQAEEVLDLVCPACGERWQALFEISEFLSQEVARQARRLLREVDALARAYGWGEREILALSPGRRQAYLELVGA